ncbi:hypothetical protein E4U31_000624 [Claviceps sp. LM219 group G6]|nr:hypothetical protein E4U31_000624 [Claviceps sp. LM219 group G6]
MPACRMGMGPWGSGLAASGQFFAIVNIELIFSASDVSNFGAYVDGGSPSREMDYISSPHIIDSINHANIDYIDTQSEVYFDYSGFPVDGSANAHCEQRHSQEKK